MELVALGIECMTKTALLKSWFQRDNPRARVLKSLIGEDRINQLDAKLNANIQAYAPTSIQNLVGVAPTPGVTEPNVEAVAPGATEPNVEAVAPGATEVQSLGTKSNEASNVQLPNQKKAPDTDVTSQGMVEAEQGAAHTNSAFDADPEDIVKQATIQLQSEADHFQPQEGASFSGVEPGKEKADAEKRRDQDNAAEPPRQDMVNDFVDMTIG